MAEVETQLSLTLLDSGAPREGRRRASSACLNLASTAAVLWLIAQGALGFRLSPGALVAEALASACFAYAWSVAASALSCAMGPILDREHLATDALRTALAAVWLAPAMTLLAHASPAAPIAALIAVAVATRRVCEQRMGEDAGMESAHARLQRDVFPRTQFEAAQNGAGLIPPVLLAAAAQATGGAILLGNTTGAIAVSAISGAALTYVLTARREPPRHSTPGFRSSSVKAAFAVLLASALTIGGLAMRFDQGNPASFSTTGGEVVSRIAALLRPIPSGSPQGQDAVSSANRLERPPVAVGSGDFPGVVLWPEIREVTLLIAPPPYRAGAWTAGRNPYSIPFGGEYWMFRPPASRPPAGSYFRRGAPITQTFRTTDGWPLTLEARQRLEQSIDLRCCSEIAVDILNAEPNADAVSLELMLRSRERPGDIWHSLGRHQLSPVPAGRPASERIRFTARPDVRYFDEFRLVLHRAGNIANRSVRVAVERFVLIPR